MSGLGPISDYTKNFRLRLVNFDFIGWGDFEHKNWQIIDALVYSVVAINNIQGIWENSITVSVGDRYIDSDDGTIWEVLVAHTTATSPTTFSFDRTSNPTYWTQISPLTPVYKGAWANATVYSKNDFVSTSDHRYAVANTGHTSSSLPATIDTDIANWNVIIDLGSTVTAAEDAQTAAETAQTAAELAQTGAETAETNAQTAQTAAELAETNAGNAQTAAEAAQTAAELAETNAAASETAAGLSETAAGNAQTAAETAQTAAELAQTGAETAETGAQTAQSNAETAETNAETQVTYAEEWANKAEDSLVSAAAGGNEVDDYSALHHAAKAAQSAAAAAADAISTAVDAASTEADALSTAADVVSTNADVVSTNADVVSTNADVTYTAEWANKAEDSLVSAAAGGDQADDYSALHHANKAAASAIAAAASETAAGDSETAAAASETAAGNAQSYAEEWANKAEDSLVSVAAGGDGATEYSAKHWAAKALAANLPLSNLVATADPTTGDDTGDGYGVGSVWVNVTDDKAWICLDATLTAAVWRQFGIDFKDEDNMASDSATAVPSQQSVKSYVDTESIKRSLGLHGTIINTQYDLDATASNSRYTPGYAGGAEFYVYFINEDSIGDATIDVNVSDGTTASQIFNDVVVPANDGIVIGPLVYTSTAYIEAAQTSGNVRMTITGTGYASGEYLTPVTHVGLVPSAGLNLFTTGSQGGIYKLILGNLHTSDLKIRLFTTSPKTYLTSVRQSLPVNNFLAVQRVKLTGSKIVRAVEDVGTNNVVSCLATGWEV